MGRMQASVIYIQELDLNWCMRLNGYSAHHAVVKTFRVFSRLGDGWFWFEVTLIVFWVKGIAVLPELALAWLTSLLGAALYKLIKQKTLRPRPYQIHQDILQGDRPLDQFSFPSGHTLHAVLFTVLLGSLSPVFLPLLVPFTVMVAASRVVLGLHYPSDVVVGALIGGVLAGAALGIGLLIAARKKKLVTN